MPEDLKDCITSLYANRFLKTAEEVVSFQYSLNHLNYHNDLTMRDMRSLFLVFEDSAIHQDVLWVLLHILENTRPEIRIKAFIGVIDVMCNKSSEWADTIISRVLNTENEKTYFINIIKENARARESIKPILLGISKENDPRLLKLKETAVSILAWL